MPTQRRQRRKPVYQDGRYRSHPRDAPHWTPGIAYGVLGVIVLIIILFVFGFFYVNPITIEKLKPTSDKTNPLPCPVPNKTIGYEYLAEDSLLSSNYKYYFYEGRMSFAKAFEVCKKIPGGGDLITILSAEFEKKFDNRIITSFAQTMFVDDIHVIPSQRKLLWTGGYIDLELDGINQITWIDERGLAEWNMNFCDIRETNNILTFSLDDFRKNGVITDPIIYIVKDYSRVKNAGCWRLFSSMIYDTHNLEFNFACQLSTARLPFKYPRRFLGKFRTNDENRETKANEYVAFSGQSYYAVAQDTCQRLAPGSQMLTTKSLQRDNEVNKRVQLYKYEIFGEDDADPKKRQLVWTGGFFNLSSDNPTKLRWANDVDDTAGSEIKPWFGNEEDKPVEYDNFCGTLDYYHKLLLDALNHERDAAKTSGCIRGRLFLVVKDFREGQPVQGCWHVYDYDDISRDDIKLYLVCQLRDQVERTNDLYRESEEVYSYLEDSKDP